jgi:L-lactate dehydrogenase complex protein LldE
LAANKVANADRTDADTLLGGDLGCLLNLAGRMRREGRSLKVFHVAEVLAGMASGPSIGEPEASV